MKSRDEIRQRIKKIHDNLAKKFNDAEEKIAAARQQELEWVMEK